MTDCKHLPKSPVIQPFLKWAGGKRWLTSTHSRYFDCSFDRYIEPFLGGGAVYFHLQPNKAILSDANADLIQCYTELRRNSGAINKHLKKHQRLHCSEYYYKVRAASPTSEAGKAARFLYLNRTCFNGLYRVNLKGEFNVPIGTKTAVCLPTDDFDGISALLSNAQLTCCDFEETISKAKVGDLLYVDPPYTANHNKNGFLKYNENIFSWDDQIRLRDSVLAAASRGSKVVVSNAAHSSVIELYAGFGQVHTVERASVLAGKTSKRGNVEEIVVVM